MFLRQYNKPIQYLKGAGPKTSEILAKMGIMTIYDLITHYPRAYLDRSQIDSLYDALKKEKSTVLAKVIAQDYIGWGQKKTLKIYIEDEKQNPGVLICFGRAFLKTILLPGTEFLFTGSFKYRFNEIQSSNFEYERMDELGHDFKKIIPVYPLTAGITQNFIRKLVQAALNQQAAEIDDELPSAIIQKYKFPSKNQAIKTVHFPQNNEELSNAVKLLKFEELFYLQIMIARKALKKRMIRKTRDKIRFELKQKLLSRLPFSLTADQQKVIAEIEHDIFSSYAMSRLLQGDVGCGKTLVALITALSVIESKEQTAFLAPTELLARQHAENIANLVEPLGINVAFLSSSVKDDSRKYLLDALENGTIDIIVGTHSLFSKDVAYKKLGYVIIDEQHKFGVAQRLCLVEKGINPDLLLMTATPIPRTLALTAFGDLEISEIKTLPAGRRPVITHLTKEGNEHKVYERVIREIKSGRQAYFVYPLIEESGKLFLKDAQTMYQTLKTGIFKEFNLGLIHSRLTEDEKRLIMRNFVLKKIDLLVATSVVEVGVDVPNATIMVVEHAERFGLSALHQLRGRVGRGAEQSYTFLIYSKKLTDEGIKRLMVMKETTDGFLIAEEDLKIRGPGELIGIKQSGFLKLNMADIVNDQGILVEARQEVFSILKDDPGLLEPANNVIRKTLTEAPPFDDQMLDGG